MMYKVIRKLLLHILLILGAFSMIIPFVWMLSTSLKTSGAVFEYPPRWVPKPIAFENYVDIFKIAPMGKAFYNSIKISTIVTFGTLFTSSIAAYAFAKIPFRGKNILFIVLLATMMIPGQVTLIPMFILFKELGWIDTHLPLMIPPMLSNAFGVFLLRQFFITIPDSLNESAKIDGCNEAIIYFRIMLPLCKPAMATLGLFTFMGNWNNFLTPLIYLNTKELFTLPLIVSSFQGLYTSDWPLLMAAASVTLIPIVICYVFAQKYFIEGITLSGIKG